MLDVIICANFGLEKLRGLEYTGVKFWVLPLKWLVTLTTVLHDTAVLEWVSKHAVRAYTTSDSAVS